jgi:hypothetical protein
MANADRNLQDLVPQELHDSRSELNQAIAAPETEREAARRPPDLEVPELNCWSGGSNTVSSTCWDGNRVARLKLSRSRSLRRCTQRRARD